MEWFDIVDENGTPTGEVIERGEAHATGACHRTAHIWITRKKDGKWQVLLQKRAFSKDSFPGCYDTSSAGHIQAGDEPLPSAIRELGEELGIEASPDCLQFIGKFRKKMEAEFYGKPFRDDEIAFVFLYKGEVDIDKLTLQKEELECVEWFDLEETLQECVANNEKYCVPIQGLELVREHVV